MTALPAERLPHYDAWRTRVPYAPEPAIVARCANPKCKDRSIREGDECLWYEGKYYCDAWCLAEALGALRMVAGEVS